MKINKLILVLFFILNNTNIYSQKFELGKVSIEELQQKTHPKDPSAYAAVLYEKGESRFEYTKEDGFMLIFDVEARIKLYKKEGFDSANFMVQYSIEDGYKESVYLDGSYTYNLVDGKIEKTKLKSEGIFDEKINRYWNRKKVTMPNVREGSVIEYHYTVRSPRFWAFRAWKFQSNIPVNYSEFSTYIPEYYIFNTNQKGFVFPTIEVSKKQKSVKFFEMERNSDPRFNTSQFVGYELNYEENKTNYILKDAPAMKEEVFVNNIDNYRSIITHELVMTKMPNRPLKNYSTNWDAVTKTIYDYDSFGGELQKTGYFEADLKPILAGATSKEQKIGLIFDFVKNAVKWNKYDGYTCRDGVKKAYKDKTGNVAEINLMLTSMLRYAGINANPVLLSTRDNGIALFPNTDAFNYVISAVESPEGLILLDATEKYATPNVLPIQDLNWFGRLIRKEGTSENVELMPKTLSRENYNLGYSISQKGEIQGKLRKQISNQTALEFRQKKLTINKDNYLESLENSQNNIEISDYVRENDFNLAEPIVESYHFKDNKSVEIINGKMYITPQIFLTAAVNPFKQEVREYPVDYGNPFQQKFNISIEIPEGYAVETIPVSLNIATPDDIGAFKYLLNNSGNKIQGTINFEIKTAIVPSDYYEVLKDFYQKMIDKTKEKIVLKKI